MEIYCWDGDWGLPSIDIGCLYVMAHAKFSEASISIKTSRFPVLKNSVKQFPMMKNEEGNFVSGMENIIKHMESLGCLPDVGLTPLQYADVVAFKALVMHTLHPYLAYHLWLDDRNYKNFSRPSYAKACMFPLNFVVPGRYHQTASEYVTGTQIHGDQSIEDTAEEMELKAIDSINLLSNYLGDKEFFIADRPTSFDALLFAYLAPLVKAKLASTKLQNHVNACDNLVRYVGRILTRYFAEEVKGKTAKVSGSAKGKDEHEPESDWFIPVAGASLVMLMYAAHLGLLTKSTT